MQMKDVARLATGQLITVTMKAKIVDAPDKVQNKEGTDLNKQDCVVGVGPGCGRLVLWEEGVGKLKEDHSFKVIGTRIRTFKGMN